jgi:hypothetical protein
METRYIYRSIGIHFFKIALKFGIQGNSINSFVFCLSDEMASANRTYLLSKLITLNFLGDTGSTNQGDIVYSARSVLLILNYIDHKVSFTLLPLTNKWKPILGQL